MQNPGNSFCACTSWHVTTFSYRISHSVPFLTDCIFSSFFGLCPLGFLVVVCSSTTISGSSSLVGSGSGVTASDSGATGVTGSGSGVSGVTGSGSGVVGGVVGFFFATLFLASVG